jgi:GTP-binding protein
VRCSEVEFIDSVFALRRLPEADLPEVAFAGRSNVGKSSLMNRLLNRKSLVKVSTKPGKTQSLNFFRVDQRCYFVDLPGYGFAKVDKKLQDAWQALIAGYIETRPTLRCVVVIVDLRHAPKELDRMLIDWLRTKAIPHLLVYTKMDKLSRNEQAKQARLLDAGFGVTAADRLLFSAKTGEGREALLERLDAALA